MMALVIEGLAPSVRTYRCRLGYTVTGHTYDRKATPSTESIIENRVPSPYVYRGTFSDKLLFFLQFLQ